MFVYALCCNIFRVMTCKGRKCVASLLCILLLRGSGDISEIMSLHDLDQTDFSTEFNENFIYSCEVESTQLFTLLE